MAKVTYKGTSSVGVSVRDSDGNVSPFTLMPGVENDIGDYEVVMTPMVKARLASEEMTITGATVKSDEDSDKDTKQTTTGASTTAATTTAATKKDDK